MTMRTYIRTLFNDIFRNNFVVKFVIRIVNFYCKLWLPNVKPIKFSTNMSIRELREKRRLSFQSVTGDKIDCK